MSNFIQMNLILHWDNYLIYPHQLTRRHFMASVSVIMGIYNCEETLSQSINSIIDQTYTDWELILCDDCSLDNTYNIAKTFADQLKNIVLLKNSKNEGLNYTLNKCLRYAKGQYIARMDGDDISL